MSLLLLIHLYYILVKLEHLSEIIWVIIDDFLFLIPYSINCWPFLASYGILQPNISVGSEYLVSLLLLTHLYYILVKLENFSDIIWTIIVDFMFLTLFSINFWPFLTSYETLEPNISIRSGYLVSLWLLIHLFYILVKLEFLSDIIWIIIDDFVFLTHFPSIFGLFCLLWDLRTKYLYKKWIFSVLIFTYPLVLHTGEIRAPQRHYLDHYWWFFGFDPPFLLIFGFFWPLIGP